MKIGVPQKVIEALGALEVREMLHGDNTTYWEVVDVPILSRLELCQFGLIRNRKKIYGHAVISIDVLTDYALAIKGQLDRDKETFTCIICKQVAHKEYGDGEAFFCSNCHALYDGIVR